MIYHHDVDEKKDDDHCVCKKTEKYILFFSSRV